MLYDQVEERDMFKVHDSTIISCMHAMLSLPLCSRTGISANPRLSVNYPDSPSQAADPPLPPPPPPPHAGPHAVAA